MTTVPTYGRADAVGSAPSSRQAYPKGTHPVPMPDFLRATGLDAFRDRVFSLVSEWRNHFTSPTDDWPPIALLLGSSEHDDVEVRGAAVELSEGAKPFLADVLLPTAVLQANADLAAVATSSWMSTSDEVRPSQAPDRKEVLCLAIFGVDASELWVAEILRSRRHLRLLVAGNTSVRRRAR